MILRTVEDSKLNKHWCKYSAVVVLCITPALILSLICCNKASAKIPTEETYTKYTKEGADKHDPGVMKTAAYCRGVEKKFDKDFINNSKDDPEHPETWAVESYRKMYNRCLDLGYCDPLPASSAGYPDEQDKNGSPTPVCKRAFSLMNPADCAYYGAQYNNFSYRDVREGIEICKFMICDPKNHKYCCDNDDMKCNEAKKRVERDKDPKVKKINDLKSHAVELICSRYTGKKLDECSDAIAKKADDCANQLAKNIPIQNISDTDVYNCITKDNKLKTKFSLPNTIDPDTSIGALDAKDNSDQKKCSDNAGFFGFFWCPGINMLTEVFDTITGMITGGLKWTILVDTRASSEHVNKDPHHIIYNTWSSVLSVANIVMIIGFIAILYSYALNSNNVAKAYNVKTLMSRLIIVAIATNFSFYICAALADLSNIAGVGIYDLIRDTIPGNGDGPFSISGLGTAISVVVGATILIVLAYMSLHLVILSLIIILALITLRQIALLMLVIVSPLAFACYLFPNTAKWFTKWWNYYIQLLIVFPLFTAVWASSRLVASVLELTHQSNLITTVLSAVTPLLAIIPIFKMSGGLMSKMTNGLQKRASKWEGRDNLRRKRVANFAKRNSMALQNKLSNVQLGDHGMGRILSGAAHLAGGGIGLVGGTLAAAANARASDNLDTLSKQSVKDINEKYNKKQDDKNYKKMENFAKDDHTVSEEMADEIKQKFGANAVTDKKNKVGNSTHPVITGAIAVKYMAMTGRGINDKLLTQEEYRAALQYADDRIVMSNDEFNIATYNVQQNGDKQTRSDFIKRHIDPEKTDHPIFMTESDKNNFINQNGLFDKNNFSDDQSLISAGIGNNAQIDQHKSRVIDSALDHSRSQYISSLNSNEYVNLSDSVRAKLAKQIVERKDANSAGKLRSLHNRVYRDINILNVNNNVKYSMHMTDMALSGIINKYSHGNSGSKPAPGTSSNTNTGNAGNPSNSGQGTTP